MKTLKIFKTEYQRVGYDENDIEPIEYMEVNASYNEEGKLLSEERYDADGELNTLTINEYDANGNLLVTEQFDQDHILLQKSVNQYDGQKMIQQINFFGEDTTEYPTKYVYDQEGHLLRTEIYDGEDLDYVEKSYEYQNDFLVKQVDNDDYGNTQYVHHFSYNEKGLMSQHIVEEIQNKDRRTIEFTYDEQNNCVKELIYDFRNTLISKTVRMYNENNQLTGTENEDLDQYRRMELTYENGVVVKNTLYDKGDVVLGWAEYTYDENQKETSAKEFIPDEVNPDQFRLLRETRYERQ